MGDWEEGDVPMDEHRKLFPMCSFVLGQPVGNIELGADRRGAQEGEAGGSGQEEDMTVVGGGGGGFDDPPGHDDTG